MSDEKLYALMVLNNILGRNEFEIVSEYTRRARTGLFNLLFPTAFRDCGMFTIYAATNPENAKRSSD